MRWRAGTWLNRAHSVPAACSRAQVKMPLTFEYTAVRAADTLDSGLVVPLGN
jgi:hypothetical protein